MPRLGDDLANHSPGNTRLLRVNMKTTAHALSEFTQTIADPLNLSPREAKEDYHSLVNRYLRSHSEQCIWLCLEHFDALADAQDVDACGYDLSFLNLYNISQVALLVCSQHPVRTRELYIAGRAVSGSKLEFSIQETLPPLRSDEMESELLRCFFELSNKPDHRKALASAVYHHRKPADFLAFLCPKQLNSAGDTAALRKEIKRWLEEFERESTPRSTIALGK